MTHTYESTYVDLGLTGKSRAFVETLLDGWPMMRQHFQVTQHPTAPHQTLTLDWAGISHSAEFVVRAFLSLDRREALNLQDIYRLDRVNFDTFMRAVRAWREA